MPSDTKRKPRLHRLARALAAVATVATVATAGGAARAAPVVYSGAGAEVADLTPTVDAFRAALGVNNGAGPNAGQTHGRREINWDAPALDAVSDPAFMPGDQFNRLAAPFARGAAFSTPGTGFFVSRRCEQDGGLPGCGGSDILLGFGPDAPEDVNFRAFSAQRIFSPVASNVMDVQFALAGSPGVAATVSAFGAVFLDVEAALLTRLEYFDLGGNSLGSFDVEVGPDSGFSFLGVSFDAGERVARVRITLGDMVLTGHGSFDTVRNDLVALDDFIYAEPVRVSAPGSLALAAAGLLAVAGAVRRSRRRRGATPRR